VTTLEDLEPVSTDVFDAGPKSGDSQPLQTVLIDEPSLRKNLLPEEPVAWPPLQDGSLEGNVTTDVAVDHEGKVRKLGSVISESSGIVEAGRRRILALRFTPFMVNGAPVQAMSQITVPFKSVRPAGSPLRVPAPI
jgi:hypothetical protein